MFREKLITLIIFFSTSIILGAAPSVIKGSIVSSETNIGFSFPTDYISDNQITFPVNLLDDGSYSIAVDIDQPIAGLLVVGDWSMRIFIHPNDTLSLSLVQEGEGYSKTITGKYRDEIEILTELNEAKLSPEEVVYEMASRKVDDYKPWMFDRYNQFKSNYLNYRSQHTLSPEFEVYLNSEVDYTYAYHLMRYRVEYPLANGLVPPLQLPSEYLAGINSVAINNTAAIGSPAYRRFIKEYIGLSREIDEDDQLYLGEENFEIISKTSPLFAQPDVPPIYQSVNQGEVVKFLGERSDFKTKSRVGGEMSEDYWYKVKLTNGREGWLIGQTIKKIEKAVSSNQQAIQQEISTKSKVVTKAKAIYNHLEVFNDPHERKVIRILGYGYEMDYPHVSTTEDLTYKFQGINRLGKFVMVDIGGQIGWVFEQGIKTMREVIQSTEQRQIVTLAALKDYSYLDRFLHGTPLYYYIAADLNSRIQYDHDANLKKDIENFLSISDNEYINNYIQYHYNELFGTQLDFELKPEDLQLVKLIGTDNSEELVSSTIALDNDIEVFQNYVLLPGIEEPTNLLETRLAIGDQRSININVVGDPLSGRLNRLSGYSNSSDDPIAYDQSENEFGFMDINNVRRPFYLKAGSDLSVDQDDLGNPIFSSSDVENVFLFAYHDTFNKRDQTVTERIRSNSELDFKTFISSLAKQKLLFLKEKQDELGLSDSFYKDITYDINYWLGYNLLRYAQKHAEYDKAWTLPKDNGDYYDFLSQIDINPVNRTLSSNYSNFIQSYFTYVKGKMENRNVYAKDLIENNFNGYSYYYLKALELYADVFKGDAIGTGKEIAQFIQLNPYKKLSRSLTTVYNANLPLRAGVAAPYFELKDNKGRIVTKADLIGKVVVLDFWATWCAPCLEKMRTDRDIWGKYSEEDVVFLYVSLDESKAVWQRFLNNNSSIKGLHAYPKDQLLAFDSPIAKSYKISSIPAFYIIGKDGNLAYNPFTTLSPGRIRDHLDNLLNPR